ncbi:hypothetical protein L2E82_16145 [Cichorium intybus]|uniref:Uncharacterized protein n=1 Tax=Cichorium intybus TaxID=13427 RepID=A0ACB9F4R4_CICIN|nr:hypothetical protein L2E82_16145 [Cichorium intybus]
MVVNISKEYDVDVTQEVHEQPTMDQQDDVEYQEFLYEQNDVDVNMGQEDDADIHELQEKTNMDQQNSFLNKMMLILHMSCSGV